MTGNQRENSVIKTRVSLKADAVGGFLSHTHTHARTDILPSKHTTRRHALTTHTDIHIRTDRHTHYTHTRVRARTHIFLRIIDIPTSKQEDDVDVSSLNRLRTMVLR